MVKTASPLKPPRHFLKAHSMSPQPLLRLLTILILLPRPLSPKDHVVSFVITLAIRAMPDIHRFPEQSEVVPPVAMAAAQRVISEAFVPSDMQKW